MEYERLKIEKNVFIAACTGLAGVWIGSLASRKVTTECPATSTPLAPMVASGKLREDESSPARWVLASHRFACVVYFALLLSGLLTIGIFLAGAFGNDVVVSQEVDKVRELSDVDRQEAESASNEMRLSAEVASAPKATQAQKEVAKLATKEYAAARDKATRSNKLAEERAVTEQDGTRTLLGFAWPIVALMYLALIVAGPRKGAGFGWLVRVRRISGLLTATGIVVLLTLPGVITSEMVFAAGFAGVAILFAPGIASVLFLLAEEIIEASSRNSKISEQV